MGCPVEGAGLHKGKDDKCFEISLDKPARLIAYKTEENPPHLIPGHQERDWMEATTNRFAYRCLPLTIANTTGWQMLSPVSFTVYWNGGPRIEDMRFEFHEPFENPGRFITSHFGHGIVTFHTGYLFRTDPGWATWARGAPNQIKDGICALDGLIETDWLPFTFTMNWLMTRPGFVHFEKNEPFCFITPIPHKLIDDIVPEIRPLSDDPELQKQYQDWSQSRNNFNKNLREQDPQTMAEGWQKYYIHGKNAEGEKVAQPELHYSKRKLKMPKMMG